MISMTTVSQTSAETHIYVDGLNGDDKNDGLAVDRPKKGAVKALAGLPYVIAHNTCLHLKNNHDFENNPMGYIMTIVNKFIKRGVTLLIDGGDDLTLISGPFTATASAVDYLTTTTPGWTTDSVGGYWIEILSGPCTGEIRQIQLNTTVTAYVGKHFSQNPGLCDFRIVRPTTTWGKLDSTTSWYIYITNTGPGLLQIQRLYSEDGYSSLAPYSYNGQRCHGSHLVCNPPSGTSLGAGDYKETRLNPSTFQPVTTSAAGIRGYISIQRYKRGIIENSYTTRSVTLGNTNQVFVGKGFRMRGETGQAPAIFANIHQHVLIDGSESGYRPPRTSEKVVLTPFLYAQYGGLLELKAPMEIINGSAGGGGGVSLFSKNGILFMNGVITGSGNVEGPVYLRYGNAILKTLAGSPPTVAPVSLRYGTGTEYYTFTWAQVEAGTALRSACRNQVAFKVTG